MAETSNRPFSAPLSSLHNSDNKSINPTKTNEMRATNKANLIYIGRFDATAIKQHRDREAIAEAKKSNPTHKYIYSEEVKRRGEIIALDVYLSPEYV